jgi:5-formyltetrahydrofolate cyclo-ligase
MQATRQLLRQQRRAITASERAQSARKILHQMQKISNIQNGQKIALYLENDGEISPKYIHNFLEKQGVSIYLPIRRKFEVCHRLPTSRWACTIATYRISLFVYLSAQGTKAKRKHNRQLLLSLFWRINKHFFAFLVNRGNLKEHHAHYII